MHVVEAEDYLDKLEKFNFDVWQRSLNGNSYMRMPLRMRKAAKGNTFFVNDLNL